MQGANAASRSKAGTGAVRCLFVWLGVSGTVDDSCRFVGDGEISSERSRDRKDERFCNPPVIGNTFEQRRSASVALGGSIARTTSAACHLSARYCTGT